MSSREVPNPLPLDELERRINLLPTEPAIRLRPHGCKHVGQLGGHRPASGAPYLLLRKLAERGRCPNAWTAAVHRNAEEDWDTAVLLRERVRRGGSFYIGSLEHRPDCRFRVERGYVDVSTHVHVGRHDLARVESVSPGTISGFAQKLASPAVMDRGTLVAVSRKTSSDTGHTP